MKRPDNPSISPVAQEALLSYEAYLREEQDVRPATLRNYLSDLRQFAAWFETNGDGGSEEEIPFTPSAVTTPTITRYRSFLQTGSESERSRDEKASRDRRFVLERSLPPIAFTGN